MCSGVSPFAYASKQRLSARTHTAQQCAYVARVDVDARAPQRCHGSRYLRRHGRRRETRAEEVQHVGGAARAQRAIGAVREQQRHQCHVAC
jgi:hypothetical protein